MKKLFLLVIVLIGFSFTSVAQNVSENALGLRMGDSDGFGAEISYQRGLDTDSRLEFDLGWRSGNYYNAFRLAGLYQWVMDLDGNFNWYVGAGGGIASYSVDTGYDGSDDTSLFLAGDIGIEYDFEIPLLISLDFRPEIGFGDYNDDVGFDIALGIRYQF